MTRMAAKDYLTVAHPPKRSKYRAVAAFRCRGCGCAMDARSQPCPACGTEDVIRFDSGAEAKRYDALRQEERLGLIKELRLQVPYPVEVRGKKVCTWQADFEYRRGADLTIEDVKGVRTPVYALKKKLVEALYGVRITEVAA